MKVYGLAIIIVIVYLYILYISYEDTIDPR